jgi:proteasome lid subunit RPN8/RPN11
MLGLDPDLVADLVAHAREGRPQEVCGVLAGTYGEASSRVTHVHRANNVADDPRTAYEIDPAALVERIEAIEAAGRDVVGFYHSHPEGPLEPSPTDLAGATWTGYSYVIVAPAHADRRIGSWRWRGDAFEAESVRIDQASAETPT